MDKKYFLVLCHIDRYKNDIAGNKFGSVGDMIVAKEFTRDIDITKGLHGIPWGYTYTLQFDNIEQGFWAVVKTELNANIIVVDQIYNIIKFRNGIILHVGDLTTASKFIIKTRNEESHCFIKSSDLVPDEQIAGHPVWRKRYENCHNF